MVLSRRLAARIGAMNVPTPGPPGGTPRLYGSRDARRYRCFGMHDLALDEKP